MVLADLPDTGYAATQHLHAADLKPEAQEPAWAGPRNQLI